ncbi:unnamed protein product [Linum trigynum]|uniref:Uncharacterized protein n=1 Tax=Linum trigynum TaxID=586398 RepID=A0AAV2EUJ7_9ROSI
MGLELIHFIDGTGAPPPQTIAANDTTVAAPNPVYRHWYRQNKLILHALRCSIFDSLYSYVFAAATSHDAWLILKKLYANRSQSRLINLKGKLGFIAKGAKDVLTYVNDMKLIAAELALVDAPLSDLDLVVHTLRSLGPNYNQFVVAVRARGTTVTIEDLLDSLIEYEADLKE